LGRKKERNGCVGYKERKKRDPRKENKIEGTGTTKERRQEKKKVKERENVLDTLL